MLIKRIVAVDKDGRPIEYGATASGRKYHVPSWGVRGHERTLQDGRIIPVRAYRKGKERNNPEIYIEKRYIFDDEKIMELAESIKSNGIIQPLILRKDKDEIKKDYQDVFKKFPRLKERLKQNAGTLSGGEQQMLAIGRALMSRPKVLLLDEPSMGLAPMVVKQIFDTIVEINKSGTTILLVEQNANMALSIANRAYVLETGKIVIKGNANEMLNNESIRAAYLGE